MGIWTSENNSLIQPTFSGRSLPSSRNPLCLLRSMVWTGMLRDEITCHNCYASISYCDGGDVDDDDDDNDNNNNNNCNKKDLIGGLKSWGYHSVLE